MMKVELTETECAIVRLSRSKLAEVEAFKRGVEHGVTSVLDSFLKEVAARAGMKMPIRLNDEGTALESEE